MSELTSGQIIKIVIAVFVLIIIIIGATLSFSNYIFPYFKDVGPGESRDFTTPYYQNLIKDENLVGATIDKYEDDKGFFIKICQEVTNFYFYKKDQSQIWLNDGAYFGDGKVGEVDNTGVIKINDDYLKQFKVLNKIQNSEKIGNEIYKTGGCESNE